MAGEEALVEAFLAGEKNVPAQKSYAAIGFRPVGDCGIVLFATT